MPIQKLALGGVLLVLLLGSVLALVLTGKLDASQYATVVFGLVAGIGAGIATAYQPAANSTPAPAANPTNPNPENPA